MIPKSDKKFASLLLAILATEWATFTVVILFMIFEIIFSLLFIGSVIPLGEAILDKPSTLKNYVGQLFDLGPSGPNAVVLAALFLLLFALLRKMSSIGGYFSIIALTEILRANLQKNVFENFFNQSNKLNDDLSVGEALDVVVRIADRASIAVLKGLGFWRNVLMLAGIIIYCAFEAPIVTIVVCSIGALVGLIFTRYYFPISRRKGLEIIKLGGSLSSDISTSARARNYVFANSFEAFSLRRVFRLIDGNTMVRVQTKVLSQVPSITVVVLGFLLLIFILITPQGLFIDENILIVSGFFGVVGLRLIEGMVQMTSDRHSFLNRLESLIYVIETLKIPYKKSDAPNCFDLLLGNLQRRGSSAVPVGSGFRSSGQPVSICIRYHELKASIGRGMNPVKSESASKNNVSTIWYGSGVIDLSLVCGIMSNSGTGKSIFIKYLLGVNRFMFEGDCEIKVRKYEANGVEHVSDLRGLVAFMDDQFPIYEGSLEDNLYLESDRQIDPKMVEEVFQLLELQTLLSEEVSSDFQLKADGSNLSLGQKQRIALARLMLSGKNFFFLDEATTGLQWRMQRNVLNWLKENFVGGLVISHSERLLALCDERYRISEVGLEML